MSDFFYAALLILVVIMMFNVMIFVHELGHFLAARWRGLKIDRFQIWFGKPIWKKEINGVQYGLGWIPAGGFVALPQMAAMESVEGKNLEEDDLPPVSPLDKIIVAFAGPLFSLLLAVTAAFVVWGLGKPQDAIKSNVVGGVMPGSAAEGKLFPGDKILKVEGQPVEWFSGKIFTDIQTRIMLSEGDEIDFEIERDGKIMTVVTSFDLPPRKWYQRRSLPMVGIAPSTPSIVAYTLDAGNKELEKQVTIEGVSPAKRSGFQKGDEVIAVDGQKVYGQLHVSQILRDKDYGEAAFTVKRGDEELVITAKPLLPKGGYTEDPKLGIGWEGRAGVVTEILYPNPWEQVRDSMRTMWMTIKTITSPSSKVGVDQLAGPIGIAKTKFLLLQEEYGWLRVLAFFVLFNVNLAVLNMLPLPVLDGGHIIMASLEWIRGKTLPPRFLETLQGGFALLLMGFMLYITTKDIGDEIRDDPEQRKIIWPEMTGGGQGDQAT